MIYCMKCEAGNADAARFCTRCGASFAADAFCETCGNRCSPEGVCMNCYRARADRREASEAADRQRSIKRRAYTLCFLFAAPMVAGLLVIQSKDQSVAALGFLMMVLSAVPAVILFGGMPGAIARGRNHPSATAIAILGWFGILTAGLLWIVAVVWAHTAPDPARRR